MQSSYVTPSQSKMIQAHKERLQRMNPKRRPPPPPPPETPEPRIARYRLVYEFWPTMFEFCPVGKIIREVATAHGFTGIDLISQRRSRPLVAARHEAMWRARNETVHSLARIGRVFCRDHTTIMHAVAKHEERMASKSTPRNTKADISSSIAKAAPFERITIPDISVSGNNHHP